MSYTEIYAIKKNGDVIKFSETQNAFRGAMSIWNIIDLKYLPPFIPRWNYLFEKDHIFHRTSDSDAIKEIWKLYDDGDTLSKTDK